MSSCYSCQSTTAELRPYGPKGQMVCFGCAFNTPVNKKETERQFMQQANAINGPVVIGSEAGPYPHNNTKPH